MRVVHAQANQPTAADVGRFHDGANLELVGHLSVAVSSRGQPATHSYIRI